MSYATLTDLVTAYGEDEIRDISDRSSSGLIDNAVVEAALDHAAAVIDAYLAGRYELPMAQVPGIIQTLACQLARFHLYRFDRPDSVVQDEKQARAMLGDLAAGRSKLSVAGVEADTADPALPQVEAPERVFGRDKLSGY